VTNDLGPEVRVVEGSWWHRLLGVALGAGLFAIGAAIVAVAITAHWDRLVFLGGALAVAGLLVAAITARQLADRVVLHGDGLVRRSRVLGDKTVRFDAITALRQLPPAPARLGSLAIEAGDVLVTIDRGAAKDLEALVATLEQRSGRKLG
jgi:hypothetical protein